MKCFLIVTKSETVMTFRRSLIEQLHGHGHTVGVIAHDNEREQDVRSLGVSFYCVEQDNRGLNPLKILQYKNSITEILKKEMPDLVFTFQLKPNTFGGQAARSAGIKNVYAMVEGAGDVFINHSLKWRLIRFVTCKVYKHSFQYAKKVFFLNCDDKAEFVGRKLVKEERTQVIPGIGVDLECFAFKPVKNYRSFLMVARMLATKGIYEYCQCARIVKQKYPDAEFCYLGAEGIVTLEDIQEFIDDGSIRYLGTTKDVRPYLEACSMLMLPSYYREGLPMSIMEAEAVGRGIITSDNVGCRDTVVEGYNGFLLPKRDYKAMAQACIYMIEHPEEIVRMGQNSRRFAEEHFDQQQINQILVKELESDLSKVF